MNSRELLRKRLLIDPPDDGDVEEPPFEEEGDEKPSNTNKGKGLILETPYKPGFVDDKDLETVKMAVDKELSDISNAMFVTTERTADTIKRTDRLEIEGENLRASIEEVDFVSKAGDVALAERILTMEAEINDNVYATLEEERRVRASADEALVQTTQELRAEYLGGFNTVFADIRTEQEARVREDVALATLTRDLRADMETSDQTLSASIRAEETARATADGSLANTISTVQANLASVSTTASAAYDKAGNAEAKWGVTVDANGAVGGIQLIGNSGATGASSTFTVAADKFVVTNGNFSVKPVTIEGTVASFNNVIVRGHVEATSGNFTGSLKTTHGTIDLANLTNCVISENCTINGTAKIADAQVDTLQIAGNAVTVPSFVGVRGSWNVPAQGNLVDPNCKIHNLYFNQSGAAFLLGNVISIGNGDSNTGVVFQVWYNGSLMYEDGYGTSTRNGWTESHTFMHPIQLPYTGTYGFHMYLNNTWNSGSVTVSVANLSVISMKR